MLVWAIYLKPKALVVGTEWRNPLFYKDAIIVLTEISIFTCDSCGNTLEYADWSKFPEGWAMYCTPNVEEAKHLCPDCVDISRFGRSECSTKQAKFNVGDTVEFEGDLYLVRDVIKETIRYHLWKPGYAIILDDRDELELADTAMLKEYLPDKLTCK